MKNRKNKNYANSYRLKRSNKHDCRRSYNTIFTNECVNIDGIKGGKSDYDNFVNIDKAVEYIKECNYLDREKHLNRVRAIKIENENEFKKLISSNSPYAFVALLISFVTMFNTLVNSEIDTAFKIPEFISDIREEKITPEMLEKIENDILKNINYYYKIIISAVVIVVFILIYISKIICKKKKILKYLTYLEKQLDSDK
uniref:hypothetical protein n=1 Tax=Ezakiella massiliensis TaxID=1852374 RepID=UPI00094E03E2|nr:hypothetical protein [Ezakiella massiliensis]